MSTLLVPFQFAPNGKAAVTDDVRQIAEQQIVDILVTNLSERVMRPEYGAGIVGHLFDPINELALADAAMEALTRMNSLNVAVVDNVQVQSAGGSTLTTAGSTVEVLVTYRLPAQPTVFTLRAAIPTYLTQETAL